MARPPIPPVRFIEPPALPEVEDPDEHDAWSPTELLVAQVVDEAGAAAAARDGASSKHGNRGRSRAIRARMKITGEPFTVAARAHDAERANSTNRGTP